MSHTVALHDMFLHYNEHGHCHFQTHQPETIAALKMKVQTMFVTCL